YTESFGAGIYDVYLIKTDSNGDTTWTKTYGGSNTDYGYSVVETSDDGCIIAGYTESFGAGSYDVYLAKTEPLAGIELTGFSASLSNEGILLKWRTECEIDNAIWLIERKNVDGEWKTITCIPSGGNSPMGGNYSYTDKDVNFHNVYYYKLGSVDQNGKVEWFNTIKINPQTLGIPTTFTLNQNYPNPFSNRTTIKYQIPVATEVEIDICDVSGRHIKRLVNRVQKPGYYQTIWDGTNEGDIKTARGIYICRMRTNASTKTKLLIRF
ncbi:MAG: T9SS type A sorting domain-containing protein, partial [Candidatus Cloacimonadota bacterium]